MIKFKKKKGERVIFLKNTQKIPELIFVDDFLEWTEIMEWIFIGLFYDWIELS